MKELNFKNYLDLIKKGYSMDHMYILYLLSNNLNVVNFIEESVKLKTLVITLQNKELITKDLKVTKAGLLFLEFLFGKDTDILTITKKDDNDFEAWWKCYPSTDTFIYNNKTFTGSRALKAKKDECKIKFNKIINEREFTAQQLIKAIEYEVLQKKEESIKNNENKLKYMQNSFKYLNQGSYEAFIELSEQQQIKINKIKSIDI